MKTDRASEGIELANPWQWREQPSHGADINDEVKDRRLDVGS